MRAVSTIRTASADNFSPLKAALLLTLALTKTTNVDEIQRRFDKY